MILSLLIILILIVGLYKGNKRGLLHQMVMTIGFTVSYWLATVYYNQILYYVELSVPYPTPFYPEANPFAFYNIDLLFEMDQAFYHMVSIALIFFAGWLVTRFIGRLVRFLSSVKIPGKLSSIGGAVLSFICHYLGVFFILFLLSLVPMDFIQESFSNSFLAETIVTNTPYLSDEAYTQFVQEPIESSNQ